MQDRVIKVPGPQHSIIIEESRQPITVLVAGKSVADTTKALIMREDKCADVAYIPRADINMAMLSKTEHTTYCPYKGVCSYYSIPLGGSRSVNAVWTYEAPFEAVAAIVDHFAFYADRIDPA